MLRLVRRAAEANAMHFQLHHADGSVCSHVLPRLILHPHQLRQLQHEIDALARGDLSFPRED